MFSGEFKAGENDLVPDIIETVFSVLEEIDRELKEKHGSDPFPYAFGLPIPIDDSALKISLEEEDNQAIVEVSWVILTGKKFKKSTKTFKLDFAGKAEQ